MSKPTFPPRSTPDAASAAGSATPADTAATSPAAVRVTLDAMLAALPATRQTATEQPPPAGTASPLHTSTGGVENNGFGTSSLSQHADTGADAESQRLLALHRPLEILQAQPARPTPAAVELDVDLLFVHSGNSNALAQTWVRRVFDGTRLHTAQLQANVAEQILLLRPQIVLIHFEQPLLSLSSQVVEQLRISHPHMPLVAVGHQKDPQATLTALRAGVQDFLDMDASAQAAQETIRNLLQRQPKMVQLAEASCPMTAILSARAGIGTSLLASHLAWYLQTQLHQQSPEQIAHEQSAMRHGPELDAHGGTPMPIGDTAEESLHTLLLDLGTPNGDTAMYLNAQGGLNFADAVRNLRRFDRKMASSGLGQAASGLRMLTLANNASVDGAVSAMAQAPTPSQADADMLLMRLRQYFRHVIADLGPALPNSIAMRAALRANEIWLMCDQSVLGVVSTAELLRQLERQKVDRSRIHLIITQHDSRLELDAQHIAQQLQLPLIAIIAERRLQLMQAVNQGQLLPPKARSEPYVQAVEKLTTTLMNAYHSDSPLKNSTSASAHSGTGLLNKLIHRIRS
ncbi:pilus assembly protein CpaE [Lampropedia hyalina DSM 16112]|uniref:Pilus assembly protein CpaE n=1 Tax=Lampropedia hyalina DSM 16112 TaxID=1122156 RepID=A0A1M4VBE2_9BURK|nr:hypothetical protein [Lampropedia hyalina]SHE66256.1 pilus assembly protein CpaE [Lampropedia hyalina DSM 16112]